MTESERQEMLRDAKIMTLAAPVVLPWLQKQKKSATDRILGKYRDGGKDYEPIIAELFVLSNLEREFHRQEETFKMLQEKK